MGALIKIQNSIFCLVKTAIIAKKVLSGRQQYKPLLAENNLNIPMLSGQACLPVCKP